MEPAMNATKPLSVFLDGTCEIDVVRDALAAIVGHQLLGLEDEEGVTYRTRALSIEWLVYRAHGLDDDCGIAFSEYSYQLQLIPLQEGQELPEFNAMYEGVASFVASKLSLSLGCRALVVANLQRKVAVFG
jgi:hypothetical protein